MSTPDTPLDLSTLVAGDRLKITGDGFDATFIVFQEGQTPGCIFWEDDDGANYREVVQILGWVPHDREIEPCSFVKIGLLYSSGLVAYAVLERETVEIRTKSVTRFKITRTEGDQAFTFAEHIGG